MDAPPPDALAPGEEATSWTDLPVELLTNVLGHAATCPSSIVLLSTVCKTWRDYLSQDQPLLRSLRFVINVKRPLKSNHLVYSPMQVKRAVKQATVPLMVTKAAAVGNVSAMVVKAQVCDILGDGAPAMRLWRAAAKGGDDEGMFRLGHAYYSGDHADRDAEEAIIWLQRVTRSETCRGEVLGKAACLLAFLHLDGEGTTTNNAEATRYFKLAVSHGNLEAEKNLGWMYNTGQYA